MIAIGFLLFSIGFILILIFGTGKVNVHNSADIIGVWLIMAGTIVLIFGITLFLWKITP